ncbi:uncharacterized protein LOC131243849 [Magnolia sinica]|uniref:uncharacterized protein LOC131243849 n=1 Tax=Magnolia sinica TaxID=86752 RepID=UPI002659776F|nr:uncharacterized protein LOC131243849 [Magnolia sinica]
MEVIIGYGGEVDSSTFPRLHSIHLEDMPKLRCFCEGEVLLKLRSLLAIHVIRCSSVKRHLLGPSSALSLQFMTGEPILPSNLPLKMGIRPRMEIIGCQTMEKIVPDEYENLPSSMKAVRPSPFENIQLLHMQHCHGFKNLLSWRLARAFEQLKELKVQGCNEMEVIIGYGGEVDSSTFPRLHSIHLEDMPKLRCFCEGEILLELQSLLTIRVISCSSVKRHLLGPSSALSLQHMNGESILPSNLPLEMGIEPRMEIIGCQTMEKIVPDEYENLPSSMKAVRPSLFENLQFLNMQHCHGFKNLLSWRLARVLEQLKELKVQGCNEMEVIIGYGGEVDSSTFPCLLSIHLEDMPKLRCFCEGEVLLELRSLLTIRVICCSSVKRLLLGSSSALPLQYMTRESILPSNLPLKMGIGPRMEIIGCQTMEKIVPDEYENLPSPMKAVRPSLFENLQLLHMQHCHGFKNLLSWRLARAFEQLKELKVQGCNEMEVIIGYGGEVDSSTFPRLHSIHLEDMPKLRCFCEGEVLLELRSLLTIRVIRCSSVKRHLLGPSSALSLQFMTGELILPSNLPLKMGIGPRMEIIGCQTMEKIVPDEYENLSSPMKVVRPSLFENLQFLNMQHCHGFKNLLSWRLARALEQLKKLKVQGCNEMEVIIGYGGEVDSSTFPRLLSIHLEDMPKLRCFCEGEVLLKLRSLLAIRVIRCSSVKRHLLGPSSALSLQFMTGESILPSNLPLKMGIRPRMEIIGCQTMEKIVPDEYENLPSPMKAVRPSLFENLQLLHMQHCHGFKNLLSWRLARALEQLKELKVQGCNEMEVIIGYGGEVYSSTFPRLHSIHLEDMPKLRCFYEGEVLLELRSLLTIRVIRCSSVKRHLLGPSSALSLQYMTGESILSSNLPLHMRIQPRMEIISCQTMEKIVPDEYENLPSPVKALRPFLFKNLQFLNVRHCHGFKNLLSWRLAQALEQLKELKLEGCNEMEVIIGYGGEVDCSTFPFLRSIYLEDMPKLRSFCEGEVLLVFRSLLRIDVHQCSSLKRLALGRNSASSLQSMRGVTEWFEALEWADEVDKSRFHNAFISRSRDELWNVFIIAVKAVGIFNRSYRSEDATSANKAHSFNQGLHPQTFPPKPNSPCISPSAIRRCAEISYRLGELFRNKNTPRQQRTDFFA